MCTDHSPYYLHIIDVNNCNFETEIATSSPRHTQLGLSLVDPGVPVESKGHYV